MNGNALLVMAKRPSPMYTKTRLSTVFNPEEAAELYACFLVDVIALARSVPGVKPLVAYAPPDEDSEAYFRRLAPDLGLVPQIGDTLGQRLDKVMSACLSAGYDRVVAMNSDSPTLPVDYLIQAFSRLGDPTTDVVLGPCEDGGYYLIGCKRPHPRLVLDVTMSTDSVLADTLAIAEEEKLRVSLLPGWYDVDELADLLRLQADLSSGSENAKAIAPRTRAFLKQNRWPIPLP